MSGIVARRRVTRPQRVTSRIPSAFAAPIGFGLMFVAATVCAQLRHSVSVDAALGIFAVLVGVCGLVMAWGAAAFTAGFGWLVFNGFVASTDGTLRWHGPEDLMRLAVLFGVALTAAVSRSAYEWIRAQRDLRQVRSDLVVLHAAPTSFRGERHA